MSKNKVIVLAVLEGGMSKAEAARRYGVTRRWVHELIQRYSEHGPEGLEARSRRPRTSPQATSEDIRDRVLALRAELAAAGLDAGPATIRWHLEKDSGTAPAVSTIRRIITAAGLVTPEPRKRPKSSLRRFAAAQPNETWQSDFTHWHLADGTDTEVIDFLDDHSRALLHLTAHPRITGPIVVEAFLDTANEYGFPASTLTDNGMVYTTRLAGGRGGRNAFETLLASLGITQKNGSPGHPQTQGKIERFHQTLKKWLQGQPEAHTLTDLNELLAKFRRIYNHERPHRALGRHTPAEAYAATPKAAPATAAQGELPRPHRPRRRRRQGHPPPRRTTPTPRHRTRPQAPAHPPARPGCRRHRHRTRHRRDPRRIHHRPDQGLPAEKTEHPRSEDRGCYRCRDSSVKDVPLHHTCARRGT